MDYMHASTTAATLTGIRGELQRGRESDRDRKKVKKL